MKSLFKLALGFCALAMIQEASAAAYTIRVTGSTAFRSATHKSIVNFLGGNATTGVPVRMTHSGSTQDAAGAQAASIATYIGTNGSDTYTIQVSFTGSVEGFRDVGGGQTVPFLPASLVPAAGTEGYANAVLKVASDANDNQLANFTFSDCLKDSTEYSSVSLNTPDVVGVIPFCWVANRGTTLTNLTAQQARRLITNGQVKKSLFTGVSTDITKYVVLTGRNKLSGTRVITLAETQKGVFSGVQQYKVTATTGTAGGSGGTDPQLGTLELWPASGTTNPGAGTGLDLDPVTGNGGYTSGGTIASNMAYKGASVTLRFWDEEGPSFVNTLTNVSVDLVGYVGISDALTASNGTNQGVILTWNGAGYTGTADNDNIIYGKYSFWANEQLYTKGTLSAGDTAFKSSLLTFFATQSNIGSSAITKASMKVSRGGDGALIGTN